MVSFDDEPQAITGTERDARRHAEALSSESTTPTAFSQVISGKAGFVSEPKTSMLFFAFI